MLVFDKLSLPEYFSLLLDAVVKHFDQTNLQEKEFVWAYGSRGRRIQHNGEAQQQVARTGSREITH